MGDPRGWEALTQQEAEQDARTLAAKVRCGLPPRITLHPKQPRNTLASHQHDANARHEALDALFDALAVAVRERDQARDALRAILHFDEPWPMDAADIVDEFQEIASAAVAVS